MKEQLTTKERSCDSTERQLAGRNRPHWIFHMLAKCSSDDPAHKGAWIHPLLAMKTFKKKSAGVENDSVSDNPATNRGTEQTTSWMISIPEIATTAAGHNFQSCICGWAKASSTTGLKISGQERVPEIRATETSHQQLPF